MTCLATQRAEATAILGSWCVAEATESCQVLLTYARPLPSCKGAAVPAVRFELTRACTNSVSTSSTTPALLIQIDGHWDDGHGYRQTPPEPRWHSSTGIGDFGNQISSIRYKKTRAVFASPLSAGGHASPAVAPDNTLPNPGLQSGVNRKSQIANRQSQIAYLLPLLPLLPLLIQGRWGRAAKKKPESFRPPAFRAANWL